MTLTATHSASAYQTKPIINGANYTAFETGDGWFTIKDLFMFSEVPKGVKDAPEDVKGDRMSQMVASAKAKYEQEKYVAPAHKGHHKMLEFQDPEFLGFSLPKRVGKIMLDGRLQDAVFGDVKLKASAFARVLKGELPYVSPEVNWQTWEFSSLSFLDSKPPHFKGPIITIGEIIKDPSAKFQVDSSIVKGKFMKIGSTEKGENSGAAEKANHHKDAQDKEAAAKMDGAGDAGGDAAGDAGDAGGDGGGAGDASMAAIGSRVAKLEAGFTSFDKSLGNIHFKMGLPYKGAYMQADTFKKPSSSSPTEDPGGAGVTKGSQTQNSAKFEDDPSVMAKFAAQEAALKAIQDKLAAKDAAELRKERIAAAMAELKGYPITDAAKNGIAKFADDEDKLKTFIEVFKAQTPKDPPKTVAAFEAAGIKVAPVAGTDPDIAEFQALGQDKAEAAMRYAMAYEAWKSSPVAKFSSYRNDRKGFIKEYMKIDPTGHAMDLILPGGF